MPVDNFQRLCVGALYVLSLLVGYLAFERPVHSASPKRGMTGEKGGVEATWESRQVFIPKALTSNGASCGGYVRVPYVQKCLERIVPDRQMPVLLFMHGCGGMDQRVFQNLSRYDLPVVAPDSFARTNRKRDCGIGGDKKAIVRLRWGEIDFAIKKLSKTPWVDKKRIILVGFSEGGTSTALSRNHAPVGRIVLGWTCNSPQKWWRGLRASKKTPVLTVVGSKDRYHQNKYQRGHCGKFLRGRPNSKSVVIPGATHEISSMPETDAAIHWFLDAIL